MVFLFPDSSAFKQCFAALISLLLHFSMGICQGFSAVLIPQLQSDSSTLKITNEESSWIASITVVSMLIGALFVGYPMEMYGRKRVIQLAFVPLVLGWAVISQSDSVIELCIGRFITGFATGMDPAVIVYIAETNLPEYRATLLSLTGPIILIGSLLAYVLGHYLFWRDAALVLTCFSAVCCGFFFFIPESPVWLMSNDNISGASKSLKWLRTAADSADAELEELQKARTLHNEQNSEELSLVGRIMVSKAWKPFLILTLFFFLQQFAGNNIILYYAVNFYEMFGTPIDGFTSSMIYIFLSLFFSFLFTAIVEKYNRRTLAVVSAIGVCTTCTVSAGYEFIYEGVADKPLPWLPLVCIWISVASAFLGINTLPWLMAGELFPAQVRGCMTSMLWMTVYLYIFISVKIYPIIIPYIKISGVLMIFSVSSFLAIVLGMFILPETRGKSLTEIERSW